MDKVRSTLKQLVRDWGREGQAERDAAYAPVLDALEREFAHVPLQESVTQPSQFTIYPYVHSASNHPRAASQLAGVAIPDIAVRGAIPPTADFSMVAGDFIEVYGAPTSTDNGDSGGGGTEGGSWDVVATCFFVDTGRNVIEYLETIRHALRDGGLWINIGPLLYHFEDMRTESSVELTLEELKLVAQNLGFEFEEERMVRSTYTSNPESMLQYVYNCWFSVARVKRRPGAVVS
ncbi:hypothetical protein HK405_004563 [Cladochytrium tenue]|nr:hypothetical protein HK405_004563 [Cladochytrium tenue]